MIRLKANYCCTRAFFALAILATLGIAPPSRVESAPKPVPNLQPGPNRSPANPVDTSQKLDGPATWYGAGLHGHYTASGEPYDMTRFTAAHRELPFGTIIRVTNLRNGRSVIVRINDRGPLSPGRMIDLSHAAARRIGMVATGIQRVHLDVIKLGEADAA